MLKKVLKGLTVIIHDPKVDRAGKALAALVAVRVVLALGGTAQLADLIAKAFGN
jgi:hypothetical protein